MALFARLWEISLTESCSGVLILETDVWCFPYRHFLFMLCAAASWLAVTGSDWSGGNDLTSGWSVNDQPYFQVFIDYFFSC